MTIGQSLSKGLQVAGKSKGFALFFLGIIIVQFGINFVFNLVSGLANAPQDLSQAPPELIVRITVLGLLGGILNLITSSFVQSGLIGVVREKIKQGTVANNLFFKDAARYFGKVFLTQIFMLAVFLVTALAAVIVGALVSQVQSILGGIVALLIFGVGIYFLILWSFAPMITVIQEESVMGAINKSYAFVRQNILSIVGLFLLVGLILLAGVFVFVLFGGALNVLGENSATAILSIVLIAVLGYMVSLFGIFSTATIMSFYLGRSKPA